MKRETHINREGNPQNIFDTVMPLFCPTIFVENQPFSNISVITEDIILHGYIPATLEIDD